MAKNATMAATATVRLTGCGKSGWSAAGAPRNSARPARAPTMMAPTWPTEVGNAETNKAAATASVARSRSGASDRIIVSTALATTATAATLRPCSQPEPTALPSDVTP